MYREKYPVRLCCLFLLHCAALIATAEDSWIELFNGKDLAGWQANADPGAFTVNNGILTAHATHPSNKGHLFYIGDDEEPVRFKNFELVIEAKGEANSNSGIFFHTDRETRDGKLHLKNGYEIQLNSTKKEKRKTGSLYAVHDLSTSPVDETNWFTIRIRVEGKHIQAWINDKQTVDYVEPDNPVRPPARGGRLLNPQGGAIALQAHDDKSTFHFRKIQIRKLFSATTARAEIHEGLVYSKQDKRLKLDLYLPQKSAKPTPCVVVIQGGGFLARNGKGFRRFAEHLAANGFAAATIGYRGRPDHTWRTTVADTKTAVRFLRSVSGKYGLDPNRIGATGRSAGATLAILLAVTGGDEFSTAEIEHNSFSSQVQAAVGISGVYDFVARFTDPAQKALQPRFDLKMTTNGEWIGTPFSPTDKQWLGASAVSHIDSGDTPVLLLHSKDDTTVPWLQSHKMHSAMQKAGARSEIFLSETGGHGGPPRSKDLMVAYFRKVLAKKK